MFSSVSKSVIFTYELHTSVSVECIHMHPGVNRDTHTAACCVGSTHFFCVIRIFTFFVSVLLGEATHLREAGVFTG